jgi:hypothetical protein
MSTQQSQQQFKFRRRARNLGLSALAATVIGVYTLQQRSTSNAAGIAALRPTPALSITPSPYPIRSVSGRPV